MQNKNSSEKTLLLVMAIIAIAVSGWLVYLSLGFKDRLVLPSVTLKSELGEVPLAQVTKATGLLKQVFNWVSPEVNGKPVPLNKSILVILKNDQLFDLYVADPMLRPPMTNKYLITLPDFRSPNVADLDPDDDGFSNLEEFNGGTDPRDPLKHPPFTTHLFLKQRVADDYIIKLNNSIDPYQVVLIAPRRDSAYIQPPLPKPFGFRDPVTRQINERFVAEDFVKKEMPNTARDVSEMKVLDRASNTQITLVRGVETNLADYYALFEFWHKTITPIKVKKGEPFYIPNVATKFKLLEVEEAKAVIVEVKPDGSEGEKLVINLR